ncbi:hypothetical protein ACFY0F_23820 [Streptomyces sp. NPDC001544]|uniref:hypothetical protein n=1 Tax=Streptomyces sp. NPDC001544 TaxID=3364584 RepID=UPI00368ED691
MSDRLTPEREAEIAARTEAATPGPWEEHEKYGRHFFAYLGGPYLRGVGTLNFGEGDDADADRALTVNAQADITALLAELAAVRAERDQARAELEKYVGKEPTVAEEMEYLSRCLNAVRDLCDKTVKQATRWEDPLPVPEWVEQVRQAADGQRSEDPDDNRRRLYLDGKGNGWISVCSDEGTEWVVPVQPEAAVEQDVRDVADETGSLREIGRCW